MAAQPYGRPKESATIALAVAVVIFFLPTEDGHFLQASHGPDDDRRLLVELVAIPERIFLPRMLHFVRMHI